ncbi:MAG: type I restriction-modification system subunit M [Clostridia bacterium]|nr:type I restriction-modification system subunit M [Clostridia bacterium]
MAKKDDKLNLDKILFNCRDYLRAARNSGSFFEKRDMMLTLVFLRFIGEKYENGLENLRNELINQGMDPDDENIQKAFFDDATFTDGTYYLPEEARWSTIINTPATELNVALDTALKSISDSSEQLKGCFIEGTFVQKNLAPNDIKKIVDEVNKISHKTFGEEKDLIGRVYEYFLKEFAVNATKEEGEYYTPHDVVQLIASIIEPYDGTLYDPCCGSGGMFIQSAALVKSKQGDISKINVYGQEKEAATYRLAKMNLALRGISHNLGNDWQSTFIKDLHKGISFDYIMANPPFNLKNWYDTNLSSDSRWTDYEIPPESNANYAWILHILSHLKNQNGVAGFLLGNGALNDELSYNIRKKLIQNDKVEAIIVLPRELFITTDISVTLWILNQNKKGGKYHGRELRNREHEILFMDLRTWTENPVKGENKKKWRLDSTQIQRASEIYHKWQCVGTEKGKYEVPELYKSVITENKYIEINNNISDEEKRDIIENSLTIENKNFTLTPSKYIDFIDHDLEINYEQEMVRIQHEMKEIVKQEKESQKMMEEAFRGIGYEIE